METVNLKSDELLTTIHYGHDYHRYIGTTTRLNQLTKLTNPDDHNVLSLVWDDAGPHRPKQDSKHYDHLDLLIS